jgi:xylulokinase
MFIGIDLGTSGVKLILVESSGKIIKTISKGYDLLIPRPMWTEQDPNAWFNQTISGLKLLVKGFENKIKAISFSGQMHGLVILDNNDKVLRNALLWNDQRTIDEVAYLNNKIGKQRLLKETGNIALTGLTAPKVLWVKNHEPAIFKKISKIMLPKDYLAYKFSGVFATDVSDVSGTLYYDVKNKKYSKYILDILGISVKQLPKVFESVQKIGILKTELKKILNIKQDVAIIIGGGDQAVGAVGSGIVNDGECSISLGTSGVVFVAANSFKIDNVSYLQSYAHSNGEYHLMGVILNAAGALKWWSEQIFKSKDYDQFFNDLAKTKIDDTLFFLPYLTGERAPINDPKATGVFFGLRVEHNKEHMDRAVIEGVTFALKEVFELINKLGVKIKKIRITGGGAKSSMWAQMIADVMDVEVVRLVSEEGPAYGAAILAMVGFNQFKDIKTACAKLVKVKDSFKPNKKVVSVYQVKFNKYRKIYPAIKNLF